VYVRRNIVNQVVVVTGASSGIGRETALELARHGACVVLAGRGRPALDSLAAEVQRLGGVALVAPTDVGDYAQVTALADAAVRRFGRIDTWVNNAGVWAFGAVEQQEVETIQQVVAVNLLGPIYGMKAALPHLRASGGTIVNVSSAAAKRALPLQAAYSAAKHGVSAFGEALRLELRHDRAPVRIVDVLPSAINTPLFTHGRSPAGIRPRPVSPVYEARVAATTIVAVARRPVRDVFAGGAGRLLDAAQRLSPALVDWALLGPGRIVERQQGRQGEGEGADNLRQPAEGPGRGAGEFGQRSKSISLYTTVFGLHPVRGRIAAGLLLAGAAVALRRLGRRR
jgi:NAD(P)-dependent dehydrogenase (short-subunit alcohol dehydrogenase family)